MSTPIRSALFSKVISPLSKSPQKSIKSARNRPSPARYLNFETSPLRNQFVKSSNFSQDINDIYIKVPNCNKLLINTPNKNRLLLCGINSVKNLHILGKGAFGTVVSGIYKDSRVAVKIIKLRKEDVKLKEQNAMGLSHTNVVKIIDVICKVDTNYGMVLMEYLNSCRHLQDILDDRTVNLNSAIITKYAIDICAGLHYCHSNKILHLDLKPANILICDDNLCKLCDFGNSRNLDSLDEEFCLGTILYAAPELLLGRKPTTKCDVYSFGVVLWQMRYRELPYSNLHGIEVVIYKVVKFNYRPQSLDKEKTEEDEYCKIYLSCWSADPKDRPETFQIVDKLSTLRH
ncbi:hypothetical protein RI129_001776 [Pyrocoelia pectoralis]|uniref:non-specific serine/threonine protein kinase n=1 Tax=Pyrocoelia pectoralis TaxID=417401 RepID=A0AAN7ZU09_9COLE